jgi:hypothetical protein
MREAIGEKKFTMYSYSEYSSIILYSKNLLNLYNNFLGFFVKIFLVVFTIRQANSSVHTLAQTLSLSMLTSIICVIETLCSNHWHLLQKQVSLAIKNTIDSVWICIHRQYMSNLEPSALNLITSSV